MKIIETRPREISFVLLGRCQNFLDDPRTKSKRRFRILLPASTFKSKEEDKDQESIQSSATPDPRHHMEK